MRAMTLPGLLLAAACLFGAPAAGLAQTGSTPSAQDAPPSAADAQAQPLAWSGLSDGQQRMLAPLHGQWDRLRPARQHRLAEHAQRWASLSPRHQQQIRGRLQRWAHMTPEQRRELRENARAFHNLTPEQRAKVSSAFRKFQSLPPAERRALRERWQKMTPEQRRRWRAEHAGHRIQAPPSASSGH
jgi:hypothetical protein